MTINVPNSTETYTPTATPSFTPLGTATPSPTPIVQVVPGRIEAEDYNDYADTTGGNAGGAYRSDDVDIEVGQNILAYMSRIDDREAAEKNYKRAFTGERFVKVEAYGEAENLFWFELTFNPILDSSNKSLTNLVSRLTTSGESTTVKIV